MTHRDAGDYSTKHGAGEKPNPEVAKAATKAADAGKIACSKAFSIVSELGVSPAEAGKTLDLLKIRLVKCQLGLFGYEPAKSIVKPAEKVSPELESAIRSRAEAKRLPCIAAWQLADEFGLKKLDVSCAAEALGIKIKPCQLGAF
jgi:hypothetical protein